VRHASILRRAVPANKRLHLTLAAGPSW
jgi:hypothetical protein